MEFWGKALRLSWSDPLAPGCRGCLLSLPRCSWFWWAQRFTCSSCPPPQTGGGYQAGDTGAINPEPLLPAVSHTTDTSPCSAGRRSKKAGRFHVWQWLSQGDSQGSNSAHPHPVAAKRGQTCCEFVRLRMPPSPRPSQHDTETTTQTVVRYHCESAQGVRGCHGVPCPHAQGWTTSRTVPPTAACREPSDGLTNRRLKSSCPCASPVAALRRATGVTCGVVTAPRSCLVWAITVMPQDKAGLLALGKRRQVRPVLQRDLSSYKGNCSTKRWMFLVPVGAPVISGAFWGHLVSIHPIALSGSE